jgi:hypothetical protein
MTPEIKKFVANLKRIHHANGKPADQKLSDSIGDSPRDACADCSKPSVITITVEDALGNERVVCGQCWRKS